MIRALPQPTLEQGSFAHPGCAQEEESAWGRRLVLDRLVWRDERPRRPHGGDQRLEDALTCSHLLTRYLLNSAEYP